MRQKLTLKKLALAAKLARGDVVCHSCGKRLSKGATEYKPRSSPLGGVEWIPVCRQCNGGVTK